MKNKSKTLPRGDMLGVLVDRLTASRDVSTQQPGQFTPAPWTVETCVNDKAVEAWVRLSNGCTLACFGQSQEIGIGLANAQLIAAVHDLLAALKGMFDLVNAFDPKKATAAINAATAAIAKAEGR